MLSIFKNIAVNEELSIRKYFKVAQLYNITFRQLRSQIIIYVIKILKKE
jgi:hypothetical protein